MSVEQGGHTLTDAPTTAAHPRLRRRLALSLLGATVIGLFIGQLAMVLDPGLPLLALLSGAATVAAISAISTIQLVGGVLHSSAELQQRYETAVSEALTDPLTGLGNHRAFQEELDRQVEQALRYATPLALVIVDLDDFKAINDSAGHAVGDRVLARLGELVLQSIRRPDRAFRVGGDEIALHLPHAEAEGARIVARRLLAAALQPKRLDPWLADGLSFSAGISSLPELASDRSELYQQADTALYAAKRAGRTEVTVFVPGQASAAPHEQLGSAVAELIAQGQMTGVYQPIVELVSRRVIGHEGLVRPQPPSPFGNPAELFAAAEADGRTLALDLACIDLLVGAARALPPDQFLSVNISPPTIEAPEFGVGSLLAILRRHGMPPDQLVVELTEHASVRDMPLLRTKLEACQRAGIRVAADDLGAGNAGLRLLSELRFDVLKVDVNLVQRSAPGALSSAIVSSVVDLAARTGALVIAEGIEDETQLGQVVALRVAAGQGYLLGRPGALQAAEQRLAAPSMTHASPMADWREAIGLPTSALA
jgi:diguanylate cyclase (GGDEF)-like protein